MEGRYCASIGAVHENKILIERSVGSRDASPTQTIFAVASISKLFISMLTLKSIELGEICSLDVDVNEILPPSCHIVCPTGVAITPRQLLTHKSGLNDDESALQIWRSFGNDWPHSLEEYVSSRLKAEGEGIFSSGEMRYHYSNFGMTVLALLLENCNKERMKFGELAKSRIFDALGMKHTSFFLSESLAQVELDDGCNIAIPHGPRGPMGHYGVAEYPAAGLRSTVNDLLVFLQQFTMPSPPNAILSDASLAEMLPTTFCDGLAWWGMDASYGVRGGGVWAHGGYMDGVRSHIFLWPQHRLGLVFMQNGEASYDHIVAKVAREVATIIGCPPLPL